MSLRTVSFQDTYWSGENDLIKEFYVPCMEESIEYCRAVGYFNSSILCYITNIRFPQGLPPEVDSKCTGTSCRLHLSRIRRDSSQLQAAFLPRGCQKRFSAERLFLPFHDGNLMVDDAINGIREHQKLDQFLSQRKLNPYDF